MRKLSGFDLGMIIAFVVVTLLGAGGWYYLSGQLDAAKADVQAADGDFDKYSSKFVFLPVNASKKTLDANVALMKSLLDPIIQTKLQGRGNKLAAVHTSAPVEWKQGLDAEILSLNNAARQHAVTVPNNFYYGFSRYLGPTPSEEQTIPLSKQLLAVEQIATIMINAPVKAIHNVRRTDEEDPIPSSTGGGGGKTDNDMLPGHSTESEGGVYTAYPFEIDFDATTGALRKVVDDLMQSPYVFVIRTVQVQNSRLTSPQISDLDKMAGPAPGSMTDSSPGGIAATTVSKGPQYLFGSEILQIRLRLDLIEWKGMAQPTTTPPAGGRRPRRNATAEGNA